MIKFFREIRKNLLIENKTTKYFKYVIDEIVLVVIGINRKHKSKIKLV